MAHDEFNKHAIQYKSAVFTDGKTDFFSLAANYWYSESNLPYVKGSCTRGYKFDKDFINYLQDMIDRNDFHDTEGANGNVCTAAWHRQVAIDSVEEVKKYTHRIVYHDEENIYDYETKEPLMSVEDYIAQVEAYSNLKSE